MRAFRFLQTRPFWLYKLAGVLVVTAVGLTHIYRKIVIDEVIAYPIIVVLIPLFIYGLFGFAALASLSETLINLTRVSDRGTWLYIGFLLFIAVFFITGVAVLGPDVPYLNHVSGLVYKGHVYYLAREYFFVIVGSSTEMAHVLYECDSLGLICHAIHQDLIPISTVNISDGAIHQTIVELIASPSTISIVVNGEHIYTFNPANI